MVVLRPTQKLRAQLPISAEPEVQSDTALGDWYANRVILDRRPLLLLVSARSLFAVLTPARSVRDLPRHLADLVGQRLGRLGIPRRLSDPEMAEMTSVQIAKTTDRSVLGIMVDYGKMLDHALRPGFSETADLQAAEEFLWDNPCYAGRPGRALFPRDETRLLLEARR